MSDVYRVLADASFPKALRKQGEDLDGNPTYLTEGRNYVAGSFVYADDLTPRDREKASKGDFSHLLTSATKSDADAYYELRDHGVFIPEHEAEDVILSQYGHETVPRDQVLALKAAGSDAAAETQAALLDEGAGDRPNLTRSDYPSLAEVSKGDVENVPKESDHVSDEKIANAASSSVAGVEAPPGIQVGEAKAEQEGAEPRAKRRPGRPKKSAVETPAVKNAPASKGD